MSVAPTRAGRRWSVWALSGLLALGGAGCGTSGRGVRTGAVSGDAPPAGPPPPANVAAAVAPLAARLERLDTVRAGLELRWEDPESAETESCRGHLTFAFPRRLRLKGVSTSFFTVFELVAGERRVWVDVPREKYLVFGERGDPVWRELPLSPEHLLVAILAHPCPDGSCLETLRLEPAPRGYRLRGEDFVMHVTEAHGYPSHYERSGGSRLAISWSEWRERGGIAWPAEIEIRAGPEWPLLRVGVGRVRVGRKVRDGLFTFVPEDDREIIAPRDAITRWRVRLP